MIDNPISRRKFLGGSAAAMAIAAMAPKLTYAASGDKLVIRAPGDIANIDPAFWQPTADEIARMQRADLILRNGAGYAKWARLAFQRRDLLDEVLAVNEPDLAEHDQGVGCKDNAERRDRRREVWCQERLHGAHRLLQVQQ